MGRDKDEKKKNKKRNRSDENEKVVVTKEEKVPTQQKQGSCYNPSKNEKTSEKQKQQYGNCNNQSKKKKSQEVFPFGNYRNYYGYRISHDTDEDTRLKVLKKEWFQGKDCLDIGCNSGIMTIHIDIVYIPQKHLSSIS